MIDSRQQQPPHSQACQENTGTKVASDPACDAACDPPSSPPSNPPSRSDVQARFAAVRAEILALGVQRLALFGSVRHDEASPGSDVDLLVEFAPGEKSFDRFMDLADLLEHILGHKIELITSESLSPAFKPHILADALDVLRAE